MNRLAGDAIPRHELLQFAARLGADVPFFASGAPFALGWGRGERLFRLPAPPVAPALLVLPPFGISTEHAYAALDASVLTGESRRGAVVLELDALGSWGGIGRLGGNDFETAVFGQEPELRALFERVAETRPLLVRLSGSGSAVIAVYKSAGDRDDAALAVEAADRRVIKTATRAAAAEPPEESGG